MLSTTVLDVAIGLVFVYLLLSLICTAILEVIAAVFHLRATNLEQGIRSLFSDGFGPNGNAFVKQVYDHGLVAGLYRNPGLDLKPIDNGGKYRKPEKGGARQLPSYIPSRTFAAALIDILNVSRVEGPAVVAEVKSTLIGLPESRAKEALLCLATDAGGDVERLKSNFENWYNDGMDRASGWYKRRTQYILLAIGFAIAVAANADSVSIARYLYLDPGIRNATVETAAHYLKESEQGATAANRTEARGEEVKELSNKLAALQPKMKAVADAESTALLPLGWKPGADWRSELRWQAIAGWVLTAIALSMGAPFWFDFLNRFMVIRSTIKPQEKSQDEPSKA